MTHLGTWTLRLFVALPLYLAACSGSHEAPPRPCTSGSTAPMCAEPWDDATRLDCCMPAGLATCVDGAWQCAGTGPSLGHPLRFADECRVVRAICEWSDGGGAVDAGPPPPSDPLALFIPTCGPADGPALEVYTAAAPFSCDAIPAGLGEHVELYLDRLPEASGETTYTWGAGPGGFASVSRCTGAGGTCVNATSGTIIVRSYVGTTRIVLEWTATFPDGTADSGIADALFCPRATFCG